MLKEKASAVNRGIVVIGAEYLEARRLPRACPVLRTKSGAGPDTGSGARRGDGELSSYRSWYYASEDYNLPYCGGLAPKPHIQEIEVPGLKELTAKALVGSYLDVLLFPKHRWMQYGKLSTQPVPWSDAEIPERCTLKT